MASAVLDVTKRAALNLTAADAVWVGTALLHMRLPVRDSVEGFSNEQIVRSVMGEKLTLAKEATIRQHVAQHCVANADGARFRYLTALGRGRRRLFLPSDASPGMVVVSSTPDPDSLPSGLLPLLGWYRDWCVAVAPRRNIDLFLSLRGAGKEIWADEHADEYVRKLREGWD